SGGQGARGSLVEELDWVLSIAAEGVAPGHGAHSAETAPAIDASVAALRAAEARLAGRSERVELVGLNQTCQIMTGALALRLADLGGSPNDAIAEDALQA